MAALAEGQRLGPFLLERRIALGGMAEVWSAKRADDREARRVALKIMLDAFGRDPTLRGMFSDEVRLAKLLRHPNIVRVEGDFEDRGLFFLAMELVEGRDLRRILGSAVKSRDPLPLPLALFIATEAARGLGHAHEVRGPDGQSLEIVHRDVSPHNLMIDRQGGVRVLDFGVARARERMTRTSAGVVKGKIAYMAPEQMLAEAVTSQADVFALGIVLWEMLAMRRLFASPIDAEVFAAVREGRVPPIREVRPEVPAPLASLVHSMLALRPKQRPESMRRIEADLGQIVRTEFSELESSAEALAEWVAPHLESVQRRTGVLPVPSDPMGGVEQKRATRSASAGMDLADHETEAIEIESARALGGPGAWTDDLEDTLGLEAGFSRPEGGEGGDLAETLLEPYPEPPLPVIPRDLSNPNDVLAPTVTARPSAIEGPALEAGALPTGPIRIPVESTRSSVAPSPILPVRASADERRTIGVSRALWVLSSLLIGSGVALMFVRACGGG